MAETWQGSDFDAFDDPSFRRLRRVLKRLPSNPRCKLCEAPFGGVGGKILGLTSFGPSRKNPNLCNSCFEKGPDGGVEGEIGVLFADVRGFTSLAETMAPGEAVLLLNRFYAVATGVLIERDAVVDKLAGDEVMALFIPGIARAELLPTMVEAAEALLEGLGYGSPDGPWLEVGIGLAFGTAFVGNVGAGEIKDFTAVGDVVNTAARLQAQAPSGRIVMSEPVYAAVEDRHPQAERMELALKGKAEVVCVYSVDASSAAAAA